MRLEQLEFLLEISKLHSISSTATKYYISPSAVSKSIKALEDELEITLLNRTNSGVEVTDEGKHILVYAKNIIHNVECIYNISKEISNKNIMNRKMNIRIATTPAVLESVLQKAITNIYKLYPNLNMDIHVISTNEHEFIRQNSEFDIIFLSDVYDVKTGRTTQYVGEPYAGRHEEEIFSVELMMVTRSGFPHPARSGVDMGKLVGAKYILNYSARLEDNIFPKALFEKTDSKILMKSDNILTIKKGIREFNGIYIGDRIRIEMNFSEDENFEFFPVKNLFCRFSAIYAEDNEHIQVIQEIINNCRKQKRFIR